MLPCPRQLISAYKFKSYQMHFMIIVSYIMEMNMSQPLLRLVETPTTRQNSFHIFQFDINSFTSKYQFSVFFFLLLLLRFNYSSNNKQFLFIFRFLLHTIVSTQRRFACFFSHSFSRSL